MPTLRILGTVAAIFAAISAGASASEGPRLGHSISAEDERPWDVTIAPDGAGLPVGQGTATEGAVLFDRLAGGIGSLALDRPIKTVGSYWPYATTLFDYVRRAMPFPDPGSLSTDETYALTAYLLWINGIVEQDTVIDDSTLPKIAMPNRDGFIRADPGRPFQIP
jgi:S-disulfanyl-L-cysteine oxidoreductase SoxD